MAKGGATTATTYIRPYKQAAGLSTVQTMEERFAYGLNPKKLGAVSSHLCDPATAAAEFLLVKSEYQAATARPVERGALFFQIRQAFPPGEVTADEANKIGYEVEPELPRQSLTVRDCGQGDRPRPKQSNLAGPTVASSVGVILATSKSGQPQAACSSLHFDPPERIEWRMVFYQKRRRI